MYTGVFRANPVTPLCKIGACFGGCYTSGNRCTRSYSSRAPLYTPRINFPRKEIASTPCSLPLPSHSPPSRREMQAKLLRSLVASKRAKYEMCICYVRNGSSRVEVKSESGEGGRKLEPLVFQRVIEYNANSKREIIISRVYKCAYR